MNCDYQSFVHFMRGGEDSALVIYENSLKNLFSFFLPTFCSYMCVNCLETKLCVYVWPIHYLPICVLGKARQPAIGE